MRQNDKVVITGRKLNVDDLVDIAEDSLGQVFVVLDEEAVSRIREARKGLEEKVASGVQVYGTTTRTGPEKGRSVGSGSDFQLEVVAGYGGSWDDDDDNGSGGGGGFSRGVCRAAWTILLNQFANGTNIISLELAEEMVMWLNAAWDRTNPLYHYVGRIEKGASISYADLTAPMQLLLSTIAKKSLRNEFFGEKEEGYKFKPGEALVMGSSNCFTMAEAAISLNKIERLLSLSELAAGLDIEAERSTPFIVSKAAEDIAQWREKKEVIRRIRSQLKGSNIWTDNPSSIHPYVTLRAAPDILATAWEALENAKRVVGEMANGHQGNPVMVGPWNSTLEHVEVGPVCSFDSTRLFIAFSNVQQAVSCLAVSIAQRGEHLLTNNGAQESQLFSRRFEVYLESSLRDVLRSGSVVAPAVGRMNCAAGYDWAAPAAQAADQLSQMTTSLKRLVGVNLLISCAVINRKLGPNPLIGAGLRHLYFNIHNNSFHRLSSVQPFSLKGILKVVDSYVEPPEDTAYPDTDIMNIIHLRI